MIGVKLLNVFSVGVCKINDIFEIGIGWVILRLNWVVVFDFLFW